MGVILPKRTIRLHKEVLTSKSLEKSHYLLHSLRIGPWTLQKSTVATNNFLAIIPCNLKCKCISSGGPLIHDQEGNCKMRTTTQVFCKY